MKFYSFANGDKVSVISETHAFILRRCFKHYARQNPFGMDDIEHGKVEWLARNEGARIFDLPKVTLEELIEAGGHMLIGCPKSDWAIHLKRNFKFGLHTCYLSALLRTFGVKFAKTG